MAASMRLRLLFDGSVCTHLSPRKCWFLVNLDNCNVVADLEYLIRERFELDRAMRLDLYLDDFLLPSMEKIHVVRDNDTLWVKLIEIDDSAVQRLDESPSPPNGCLSPNTKLPCHEEKPEKSKKRKSRKRKSCSSHHEASTRKQSSSKEEVCKPANEANKGHIGASGSTSDLSKEEKNQHQKRKRSKKVDQPVETAESPSRPSTSDNNINSKPVNPKQQTSSGARDQQKKSKKSLVQEPSSAFRKNKRNATKYMGLTESRSDATKKAHRNKQPGSASDSHKAQQKSSSRTVDDPGECKDGDEQTQLSGVSSFPVSGVTPSVTTVPSVQIANSLISSASGNGTGLSSTPEGGRHKGSRKNKLSSTVVSSGHIRFESSSESDSSSSEDADEASKDTNTKQTNQVQITTEQTQTNHPDERYTATNQPLPANSLADNSAGTPPENLHPELQSSTNGQLPISGPIQMNSSPSPQRNSNARGKGQAKGRRGNWDKNSQMETRQSNKSVIQKAPQEAELPPKDFASFPALVGPPRQGDIIAYKILELSQTYCPELSDYKEAKVLSVDAATGQIEVELSSASMATRPFKPGKFDLQWEEPETDDGAFVDEPHTDTLVCLQLQDLVEARLVPSTSA